MPRNYYVFISHSWTYDNDYKRIRGWLEQSPYFHFHDYSVPITKPLDTKGKSDLQKKLRDRIKVCSCVIIISGMYANYSEWIDYEIDTAIEYGKPIIGVRPWGNLRTPLKIQNNATEMVGWNMKSVVDAIRKHAL